MYPEIENTVASERQRLDLWLSDAYARYPDTPKNGELEAGYPYWDEVEILMGRIFDEQMIVHLSFEAVQSLLFFISRSDELGRIIAWIHTETGTPFSNIGQLSYDDFIFFCQRALAAPDDFCDYQFVNCFQKMTDLSPNDESLLEDFFQRKTDSYTRRLVIHALARFQRPKTIPLIHQLWVADDCEFAKLSCLYSLGPFPESRDLFRRYLNEYKERFPEPNANYRKKVLERLLAIIRD